MKKVFISCLSMLIMTSLAQAQSKVLDKRTQAIYALIDQYSLAREKMDTVLLKKILTPDIDQLVSSGEWRNGVKAAVAGMLRSSAGSPGKRTLLVEKVKFFNAQCGIADARYEIQNSDGTTRKMWSTFVVVLEENKWKISAIRNMLPAAQ